MSEDEIRAATIRTKEEIKQLKDGWVRDPCWDIEYTEGFEAHEQELREFSKKQHKVWEVSRTKDLQKKAEKMGIPGNLALAAYIESLEDWISRVEKHLSDVAERETTHDRPHRRL
jgi:tRNA U55 pseudouridine synthase TruB